jgi:hypothetical protein
MSSLAAWPTAKSNRGSRVEDVAAGGRDCFRHFALRMESGQVEEPEADPSDGRGSALQRDLSWSVRIGDAAVAEQTASLHAVEDIAVGPDQEERGGRCRGALGQAPA